MNMGMRISCRAMPRKQISPVLWRKLAAPDTVANEAIAMLACSITGQTACT